MDREAEIPPVEARGGRGARVRREAACERSGSEWKRVECRRDCRHYRLKRAALFTPNTSAPRVGGSATITSKRQTQMETSVLLYIRRGGGATRLCRDDMEHFGVRHIIPRRSTPNKKQRFTVDCENINLDALR